jgi:hypothetical protein
VVLAVIGLPLAAFGLAVLSNWRDAAGWVQRVNRLNNEAVEPFWNRGLPLMKGTTEPLIIRYTIGPVTLAVGLVFVVLGVTQA